MPKNGDFPICIKEFLYERFHISNIPYQIVYIYHIYISYIYIIYIYISYIYIIYIYIIYQISNIIYIYISMGFQRIYMKHALLNIPLWLFPSSKNPIHIQQRPWRPESPTRVPAAGAPVRNRVQLVQITPIKPMVYGRYNYSNYSIHGVNLNQRSHHWGAPSCRVMDWWIVHETNQP